MMGTLAVIKDTFRECLAKKILLLFFIVSNVGIFGIMAIFNIDIIGNDVAITSLFARGEEWASLRQFEDIIIKVEAVFAMTIFTLGLFLSIFSTSDLVPSLMTKGRLDLYLARPISRPQLLMGKYIGAVAIVSVNILYAIFGLWLVIGFKSGVWNPNFLYAGLNIIFMFSILYTFVILIGLFFRSTSIIIISVYLLVSMSAFLAQREEFFVFVDNKFLEYTADVFYWIIPKYYEVSLITKDMVEGYNILSWTPVIATLITGIVVMNLSLFLFSKKNC